MSAPSTQKNASRSFRRLFRTLARPIRRTSRQGGLVIQAYRGYGHRDRIVLMGRVLKQPTEGSGGRESRLLGDLKNIGRRFLRHGIADACVLVRAGSGEERVVTDGQGYFEIFMKVPDSADWRGVWRPVDLRLLETESDGVNAQASVFFPPRSCRFVVISDIDDTVMYTGVANKIKMLWRLFASTAESRLAFPGVGAFYRALHEGVSGTEQNPMLYVSRAPWGIYEVLEDFFNLHKIPIGPVLFLREWGVTLQHPLPKQSKGHKNALIEDMLAVYDDLPFVLIGDSGQRDPEIYSRVVQEHRSRVLAVYIRNVSRDAERIQAIETLATQVAEAGSSLVLAADSQVMASHAADRGLISRDTLQAVHEEREQAGEEAETGRARCIGEAAAAETRQAVEEGELRETLESPRDKDRPDNVVVK